MNQDYFDIIKTPMDFGTICENLENGVKYMNSADVFKDVEYIWHNCVVYNKKGDHILKLMNRVKTFFMKHWIAAKLQMEQTPAIIGMDPTHCHFYYYLLCKHFCDILVILYSLNSI